MLEESMVRHCRYSCPLRIFEANFSAVLRERRETIRGTWRRSTPIPNIGIDSINTLRSRRSCTLPRPRRVFSSLIFIRMDTSVSYIGASCNRFNQAADVSPSSSLIAFGCSSLIALWDLEDPKDAGVAITLPDTQGLITCVRFLTDAVLLSASDTGIVNVWCKRSSQWEKTFAVQAHPKSISTLCVEGNKIVTGSSDSSVKIWNFVNDGGKDNLVEVQTISMKRKFPLALAMTFLPQTQVSLLAIAGTDTSLQLWACSEDKYVHSATLAGHEDWIRSLAFKQPASDDSPLVLASGSQDSTIRLWNIEQWKKQNSLPADSTPLEAIDELLDNFEASLGDLGDNEEGGKQISLKHHIITVKTAQDSTQQFSITFDALLVGHEAGITSLSWRPSHDSTPTLLSTSTDSSLILWSPSTVFDSSSDESSSIWINRQRFGDVGGQRLGGFTGGLWAKHGNEALAWGWAGGWRRWASANASKDLADETWAELGAVTGHKGAVKGLDWSPDGKYLISTGLDQTTRIHGPVQVKGSAQTSWHEIARPQVHGYDLLNVVFVDSLKFASIADEKVLRVFEAPRTFVELAEALGVAKFDEKEHQRPAGANVPPLGLSNKAISDGPQSLIGETDLTRRPFDSELASITLWPEIEKVFGHGYESITLGISHSRKLIATACRATNLEHAVVRVYDTETYKPVGKPLQGHILTVTRVAFSPDDRHILTVSRDRSWRLFELHDDGGYEPVAADKSHGRIIWDCDWTAEGDVFATASRDKTVKIWHKEDNVWRSINTIKLPQPATAVAFSPAENGKRIMAIGLENGEIIIYTGLTTSPAEWKEEETIGSRLAHVDHIHRMSWRPKCGHNELATCSEDGTLRILNVGLRLD